MQQMLLGDHYTPRLPGRGEHRGISHNPLESSTSDDMELAVRAFQHLLQQIASPTRD